MKRFFAILSIALLGTLALSAQSSGDYKKLEVSAVYTQADLKFKKYEDDFRLRSNPALGNTFRKRDKFRFGGEAAATYNFSRYIGARGSFSFNLNQRRGRLNGRQFEVKERLYNYMGGIQIKDNKIGGSRLKPFAYVMAGFATTRSSLKDCSAFGAICPSELNRSRTKFASAIGAGLDIRISDKVSIRAFQIEYQRGKAAEGVKVSTGIVF
jgi:opacity protein-like surface antigen